MKIKEFIDIINRDIPEQAALKWDNVGLLVGDASTKVQKVYIALDATEPVVDRAISCGADLIITHHPMIFSGMKQVRFDDFTGRRIMKLVEQHVACYAMHTNFDVMKMADLAAERLGLHSCVLLDEEEAIGQVGTVASPVTLRELADNVRDAFGLSHVKVFGAADKEVQKLAVCPGSGKSEIEEAIAKQADVLITGDIDHHSGIDAVAQNLMIIDAGHYGLEHIFIEYMEQYIRERCGEITVVTEPFEEPFWMC